MKHPVLGVPTVDVPRGRVALTRKFGQSIVIGDGPGRIIITIGPGTRGKRKVLVDAPRSLKVLRGELFEQPVPSDSDRAA